MTHLKLRRAESAKFILDGHIHRLRSEIRSLKEAGEAASLAGQDRRAEELWAIADKLTHALSILETP